MLDKVKIIECPRDAMQSIKTFIPTNIKLSYLQSVVDVGFDVVDIGSFVSPKAIPNEIPVLVPIPINNPILF